MILLARPRPHLPRTRQALQAMGYGPAQVLSFSLAEPQPLPLTLPPSATALLLTSPLACAALAQAACTLPVYAVGPTTAAAARAQGLQVVFTGNNNGVTLAHNITALNLPPQRILHLHGDKAGTDWHSILTTAGHTVTPLLAYRTHYITTLPEPIRQALHTPHSSLFIPLFSAGAARHLAKLLKQANIAPSGTALCLSSAVAAEAAHHWPQVRTAAVPTQAGLLALLPTAQQKG